MSDDPFSLFDEVLDLHTRWQSLADEYERHAADLLARCSSGERPAVGVYLGLLDDLRQHVTQWAAITTMLEDLEGLLVSAQERSVSRGV